MSSLRRYISTTESLPGTILLVRTLVGTVFLAEGIQKFLLPDALGVGRFMKIGIPIPEFMAPFVGCVEIVGGSFLLIGFLTRLSAVALLIDIGVAIISTKIPMLFHEGFWKMAHEARTDWCMFLGSIALIVVGGGKWSVDRSIARPRDRATT